MCARGTAPNTVQTEPPEEAMMMMMMVGRSIWRLVHEPQWGTWGEGGRDRGYFLENLFFGRGCAGRKRMEADEYYSI